MQDCAIQRMRKRQLPCMQQQAMHAKMDSPEPVVVAATMTGITDDVMRDVMQVFADLPIAAGLGPRLDQCVALLRILSECNRQLGSGEHAPTRQRRLAR